MSTATNTSGDAKASGNDNEIGDDLMQEVAHNLGQTLPKPAAEAAATETDEDQPSPEATAGSSSGGAAGEENGGEETAEEKTAREAAEAEAAGGEETEEEKTAREAAEAEEAAANPAKADKDAAAKELETALKDAAPEVRAAAQKVIDGLIDKVVVKERAEVGRLGSRVTELTSELEHEQRRKGPTIVGTVHPSFMADDVSFVDEREEQIEKFERWAASSIRAGGVNLPDSGNYDDKKPSYTVDQIEGRLDELLHEKKKILPAARANLQTRATIDQNLRAIYPAIYDPKTPEYAQVQQVLKALPELKQFADYRVIALKQILGDRALAEILAKRKKESLPQGQDKKKGAALPLKKTPPRAPGSGATAKGGVLDPKSSKTAAPEAMKKVMKDPGNKAAFAGAVGALLGADF